MKALHNRDVKYVKQNRTTLSNETTSCSVLCWKRARSATEPYFSTDAHFSLLVGKTFEICAGQYCLMAPIVGGGITCYQMAAYCMKNNMTLAVMKAEVRFTFLLKR